MDLVGTLINAFVMVGVGAFLTYVLTDRHKKLEARLDRLEIEVAGIRTDLVTKADKTQVERLEERMDSGFNALRADLTQVALAVGARPRAAEG